MLFCLFLISSKFGIWPTATHIMGNFIPRFNDRDNSRINGGIYKLNDLKLLDH